MAKTFSIILGILIFSFSWTADNGQPFQRETEPGNPYVPNRVVIKISADSLLMQEAIHRPPRLGGMERDRSLSRLLAKYPSQLKQIRSLQPANYYLAETINGCDIEALCRQLRLEPFVKDASPDYYAVFASTIPNDYYFNFQYGLNNTGQVYIPGSIITGTPGSDIKAVDGWDWTRGSDQVIIAVLDSGVATDHEDLLQKVVPGYDFVNDDGDAYDDNGHGTLVASIAAAETNNGVGIAGVSWQARIMPVKVVSSDGFGSYLAIAAGIRYAVDNGARVLNLSLGGRSPSFILEDACEYAYNSGAVIVAAAGNTNSPVVYPAAYDDYCLAVAATDANDARPGWSNWGPQVDVAAPGDFVWGAQWSPAEPDNLNSYSWDSGTSYAAPYVAGAAALLMAYKPSLTNRQIMALIKYTADDVNASTHPGIDDYIGYGRINLKTLLEPYEIGQE